MISEEYNNTINLPDVLQVGNLSEDASIPNPYRHRVYLSGGVSPTINTYGSEHAPHIIIEKILDGQSGMG